jgi:hypothetical protein
MRFQIKKALIAPLVLVILIAAGVISAVFIVQRTGPLPVWLVEESLVEEWQTVLAASDAGPVFTDVDVFRKDAFPENRYGYIITANLDLTSSGIEDNPDAMVRVYPGLAGTLKYNNALLLALDPWAVFYEFTDPGLSRERVEGNGELTGLLAGPGGEPGARVAWLSQLLQEEPGVFPEGKEFWEAQGSILFQSPRFQQGAFTYNWTNAWDVFLANKPAWIYAPLSMARSLRPYQSAGFVAARFPEKEGWTRYGIQAELLWAVPFGDEKYLSKINKVESWLKDGAVQTFIANTLNWIPAAPNGSPYNALSRTVQLNWLRSSFVWEAITR